MDRATGTTDSNDESLIETTICFAATADFIGGRIDTSEISLDIGNARIGMIGKATSASVREKKNPARRISNVMKELAAARETDCCANSPLNGLGRVQKETGKKGKRDGRESKIARRVATSEGDPSGIASGLAGACLFAYFRPYCGK